MDKHVVLRTLLVFPSQKDIDNDGSYDLQNVDAGEDSVPLLDDKQAFPVVIVCVDCNWKDVSII